MRELEDVALAFDRACREAGVAYALMEGIAVAAWGQPRMTMDVDALVRLDKAEANALVTSSLRQGLRTSAADLVDAIREGTHATVFDEGFSFHVDVKIARTQDDIAEVENALDVPFGKGMLRIVRAEDTIAFKLTFGSEQDVADARSILARREGKLDLAHIERLCLRLGVAPAWHRLLKEAQDASGPKRGPGGANTT